MFPLLSSFSGAIDWEATQPEWIVNPLELFKGFSTLSSKTPTPVGVEEFELILKAQAGQVDSFNVGRLSSLYDLLKKHIELATNKATRKGLYAVSGR